MTYTTHLWIDLCLFMINIPRKLFSADVPFDWFIPLLTFPIDKSITEHQFESINTFWYPLYISLMNHNAPLNTWIDANKKLIDAFRTSLVSSKYQTVTSLMYSLMSMNNMLKHTISSMKKESDVSSYFSVVDMWHTCMENVGKISLPIPGKENYIHDLRDYLQWIIRISMIDPNKTVKCMEILEAEYFAAWNPKSFMNQMKERNIKDVVMIWKSILETIEKECLESEYGYTLNQKYQMFYRWMRQGLTIKIRTVNELTILTYQKLFSNVKEDAIPKDMKKILTQYGEKYDINSVEGDTTDSSNSNNSMGSMDLHTSSTDSNEKRSQQRIDSFDEATKKTLDLSDHGSMTEESVNLSLPGVSFDGSVPEASILYPMGKLKKGKETVLLNLHI